MAQENTASQFFTFGTSALYYLVPLPIFNKLQDSLTSQNRLEGELSSQQLEQIQRIYSQSIEHEIFSNQNALVQHLQDISGVCPIKEILLGPKISQNSEWKILGWQEWDTFDKKFAHLSYKIPIILPRQNPQNYIQKQLNKIQIIFDNSEINKAFHGFVSAYLSHKQIIQTLMIEFGYDFTNNSVFQAIGSNKNSSIQQGPQISVKYCQIQILLVKNITVKKNNSQSDDFIFYLQMNIGVLIPELMKKEKIEINTTKKQKLSKKKQPRVRSFSVKKQQQIEEMKQKYFEIMKGPRIKLPSASQLEMEQMLQDLAKQSLSTIGI